MRRSILQRRGRRKIKKDFELQLTSMMDMLIILIVFLLKSDSMNAVAFATSSKTALPNSMASELPIDATNLVVEPTQILLDGEKIVEFKQAFDPNAADLKAAQATYEMEPVLLADGGRRILPLYDALVKSREKAELLMSKAIWKDKDGKTVEPKFHGALIIHADKSVRYELLRKVMYTAGAAQFKTFKFVTVQKEEG